MTKETIEKITKPENLDELREMTNGLITKIRDADTKNNAIRAVFCDEAMRSLLYCARTLNVYVLHLVDYRLHCDDSTFTRKEAALIESWKTFNALAMTHIPDADYSVLGEDAAKNASIAIGTFEAVRDALSLGGAVFAAAAYDGNTLPQYLYFFWLGNEAKRIVSVA